MYVLGCNIKIGNVTFTSVHEVRVKRSVHSLAATASIKVPVTAVLKYSGEAPTAIETAAAIKVGDAVHIKLGYNGELYTEFVGYVKQLNYKAPLEIECEDNYYLLRSINTLFSAKKTTLKECLNAVLPGFELGVVADLTLKNFVANNISGARLLGQLKKDYGLVAYFDLSGNLNVCQAYDVVWGTVKYRLHHNVVKDDSLVYQLAEDVKLKIRAICYYRDGSKVEGELGVEGGAQKTLYFYDVEDAAQLKTLAQAELARYSYDGYCGKITTMLQPYAQPTMVAQIEDSVYGERSGSFFIDSTEVTFGKSGARRVVEVGVKI